MDYYLGCILIFGGNYEIQSYAFCNGQQMSIQQNAALYSLLGTTYGGNGTTSFNLPDLRGRMPIHFGQMPGGPGYALGQRGGNTTTTLTVANLPAHNHPLNAVSDSGASNSPAGNLPATLGFGVNNYRAPGALTTMSPQGIGNTGSNQPIDNMQPYLAMNYLICTSGLYPPRA